MIKVLVTGFKHSGTTMMMTLLNAHPQVGRIENEKGYIEFDQTKDWVLQMASNSVKDMKRFVWGEKLPWGVRDEDLKAERPIRFSKRWLEYFGKHARIIHMIRHPVDVSLSLFPMKIDNKNISEKILKYYFSSVPKYIEFINSEYRCCSVVYEDILNKPKIKLPSIFNFLNLQHGSKLINKILKDVPVDESRAFAYKRKGINSEYNYDQILEKVKRIL
jgi:hypothetical protein